MKSKDFKSKLSTPTIMAGKSSDDFTEENDIFVFKSSKRYIGEKTGNFKYYEFEESEKAMEELLTEIEESKGDGKIELVVNVTKGISGKKYLLYTKQDEVEKDKKGVEVKVSKEKLNKRIAIRHLKAMGFEINTPSCKECSAYGPNSTIYNCSNKNKFECVNVKFGDDATDSEKTKILKNTIEVAYSSAMIILQSIANPDNPVAQPTGEKKVITGIADDMTMETLKNNFNVMTEKNGDIIGGTKFNRNNMIKDWKPVKYETISYGVMPPGIAAKVKARESNSAINLPGTFKAWAIMVQGLIEYNKTATKKLEIRYLMPEGQRCGFRSYDEMAYFRVGRLVDKANFNTAAKLTLDSGKSDEVEIMKWYNGLENKSNWKSELKIATKGVLKGIGSSMHGIGRAFDFVCGSRDIHYIKNDKDGQDVLYWLQDNAGRYGFTGLIDKTISPMSSWVYEFKEFKYSETWHWEYLVDDKKYTKGKKEYVKLDCFIKEKRDELLK